MAFKIATDPYVGRLAFKCIPEDLMLDHMFLIIDLKIRKEFPEFIRYADKQNAIDFIEAGDIGAAVGFKDIKTGDTLSSEKHPIILESMIFQIL